METWSMKVIHDFNKRALNISFMNYLKCFGHNATNIYSQKHKIKDPVIKKNSLITKVLTVPKQETQFVYKIFHHR